MLYNNYILNIALLGSSMWEIEVPATRVSAPACISSSSCPKGTFILTIAPVAVSWYFPGNKSYSALHQRKHSKMRGSMGI